jgi:hypothetical protein
MAVRQNAAPAPAPAQQRVSFRLDNFSQGGVLPEGDYLIKDASFVLFTYTSKDGVAGATTTALRLLLQELQNGEPVGDEIEQHYSVGSPEFFVPSEDGLGLVAAGSKTTLAKGSNFFIFMENVINAGFPEDKFDNDASIFNGTKGHIVHIPAPERKNLKQSSVLSGQVQDNKRKFDPTIPVFKTIIQLPWETSKKAPAKPAATKTTPKPAAAATKAPEPEASETDYTQLAGFILDVVTGNGGTFDRTQCRLQVHRKYNAAKIEAATRDAELSVFSDDAKLKEVLAMINCVVEGRNIVSVG